MQTLDKQQAAKLFHVSVRTIDRWRTIGRLPAYQIVPGGRVLFRRDDIERLLEESRR